jgi:hypothetical protein
MRGGVREGILDDPRRSGGRVPPFGPPRQALRLSLTSALGLNILPKRAKGRLLSRNASSK